MKFYSKNQILLLPKKLAFEKIINHGRSITKSDPAIEIEPITYCNISPIKQLNKLGNLKLTYTELPLNH